MLELPKVNMRELVLFIDAEIKNLSLTRYEYSLLVISVK
jgi:hypothetical protein